MNGTTIDDVKQEETEGIVKKTRTQCRREAKEEKKKTEAEKKAAKERRKAIGLPISDEEIERRKQAILKDLKCRTWRDLETQGKFGSCSSVLSGLQM